MDKKERKATHIFLRADSRDKMKALSDMMTHGTGAIFVPNDGSDIKHIPVDDFLMPKKWRK